MQELSWQTTFHPDSDPAARRRLDDAVLASRLDLAQQAAVECERRFGLDRAERATQGIFASLFGGLAEHREILDDPVFTIWLRVTYRALGGPHPELALAHLERLPDVVVRVEQRLNGRDARYAPGTSISVQRDELDLYVKAVTPPSYDFTQDRPTAAGHSLELQAELIGHAVTNIGACWPDERDDICELVKIIGYLPDATFRSCSAARYAGVVYLANQDDSVLDIEESLVHEAGHQLLYRFGEVAPLTQPDTPKTPDFVLPWSGSERDLFGFLHACYIYVLLVKYYRRRRALDERQASDCDRRAGLILVGLLMAMPMISQAAHLSPQGRQLVAALAQDVERLRDEVLEALSEGLTW